MDFLIWNLFSWMQYGARITNNNVQKIPMQFTGLTVTVPCAVSACKIIGLVFQRNHTQFVDYGFLDLQV